MRNLLVLISSYLVFLACEEPRKLSSTDPLNWNSRTMNSPISGNLHSGSTFLSVYSQIYVRNEKQREDLTVTVSLHNPNLKDSVFVDSATYYDTKGKVIRSYFDTTIYVQPMETVQIIIDGIDNAGGTGANFVFNWHKKETSNKPLFEAVMISTYGKKSISFVTEGKSIKK